MPTYEYRCTADEAHNWEATQSIKDPKLTECPSCKAPAERLISRTSFALKGGGWYAQGYGATPPPAASQGSAPSSSVSDSTMAAATTCPTLAPTKA